MNWTVECLRFLSGGESMIPAIESNAAMQSELQRSVAAFNRRFTDVPDVMVDQLPDFAVRRTMSRVLLEEVLELFEGFGARLVVSAKGSTAWQGVELDGIDIVFDRSDSSLRDVVDACADIIYVALGIMARLGVPDEPVMTEVCRSNDSKFAEGHYVKDGKLIKSPHYQPARLSEVLTLVRKLQHAAHGFQRSSDGSAVQPG